MLSNAKTGLVKTWTDHSLELSIASSYSLKTVVDQKNLGQTIMSSNFEPDLPLRQ